MKIYSTGGSKEWMVIVIVLSIMFPFMANSAEEGDGQNVFLSTNVRKDAEMWANKNPFGIAVAVHLGTSKVIEPYQIEAALTNLIGQQCGSPSKIFFEQNDAPGTGFSLYFDKDKFEPSILMKNVVDETKAAVRHVCVSKRLFQGQ